MSLAQARHLLDRRKAAANGPTVPLIEIPPGLLHRIAQPEAPKHSLIAHAREVSKLSSLRASKRWACWAGLAHGLKLA